MEEYTFNDIIHLEDKAVQKILHETDHYVIASALVRADTAVQDKIFRNVSKRVLPILKDDMKNMSSYDGKAQDKILAIMRNLINMGEICTSNVRREIRSPGWSEKMFIGDTEIKETFADMMERIEEGCKNGRLHMPSYSSTEDDAKKAFEAFQNRRDELARIESLFIDSELLPAVTTLLEADTVRELFVCGISSSFQWSCLEKCHSLTSLIVKCLGVTPLPDWICNLENLTTLEISDSSFIEQLPDNIGNLKSLTELVLENNENLSTLPDSIGNLKSLTKLELENNENLRTLPDSIGNLKNLTVLKIRHSPVEKLPDSIINLTALEYVDIFGTNINSVPPSVSSVKTFIANSPRIELIPQEHSISYRGFVNCYYRLVETVLRLNDKAIREGLLALEDELEFLADDFFRKGLRIVIDGTDAEIIRHLLTISIERENDFYRKKLMELAREGILCIQAGHKHHKIIFLLNSMVDIKNNPVDAACSKYLSGDGNALFDIDFESAILPEGEREEVSFIKRALALSEVIRQEGFLAAESRLDHNGIAARDVFEYGIPMIIDGYDNNFIDTVLTRLIGYETDPVRKNLALAKKDAVLSINADNNTWILALTLSAYFDRDVAKAALGELLKD